MSPSAFKTEPEPADSDRRVLRGIYSVAMLFSAFSAAHSVLITGQCLNDEIPAGRIHAIIGHSKMGPRLRLDNGHEAVFWSQVLYRQAEPVKLKIGDQVEKQRDSFVYTVNGIALTDMRWGLANLLLP